MTNALDDLERYLDPDRGKEKPTFCLHCGGADLVQLPEDAAPGHAGPRCLLCGTMWVRSFTGDCPNCGQGGGWVHLRTPVDVTRRENKIVSAWGTAWCDVCALPWAYKWKSEEGGPILTLVGFGRNERSPFVSYSASARTISTDS